jgi:hypothetical protein
MQKPYQKIEKLQSSDEMQLQQRLASCLQEQLLERQRNKPSAQYRRQTLGAEGNKLEWNGQAETRSCLFKCKAYLSQLVAVPALQLAIA